MISGIGSLPFTRVDEAIDRIFSACREVPFWPQLPKRSFLEDMYVQFLEQVPCVIIDEQGEKVYVDTATTSGIERFYEDVATRNLEAFRVSEAAAPGLYRLLERLPEIKNDVRIIKGQLTGPFTIGLGLKDEKGQSVIYNSAYFDIIKKALHMKAAWMISFIKSRFPEKEVMIFFDEPFMVSFGSAYVSIAKSDVVSLMNEVLGGARGEKRRPLLREHRLVGALQCRCGYNQLRCLQFPGNDLLLQGRTGSILQEGRRHLARHCAVVRGCPILPRRRSGRALE